MRSGRQRNELVLTSFSKLEIAQAATSGAQLPRETPAPAVQITALYGERKFPQSTLYFVAEKKYRAARFPRDPKCNALTAMTGWLVPTDEGTFTLTGPKVFLTDCDLKETRTGVPFAALRVAGQSFWVRGQRRRLLRRPQPYLTKWNCAV